MEDIVRDLRGCNPFPHFGPFWRDVVVVVVVVVIYLPWRSLQVGILEVMLAPLNLPPYRVIFASLLELQFCCASTKCNRLLCLRRLFVTCSSLANELARSRLTSSNGTYRAIAIEARSMICAHHRKFAIMYERRIYVCMPRA